MAAEAGATTAWTKMVYEVAPDDREALDKTLAGWNFPPRPGVTFQLGGGGGPHRDWPVGHFLKLAELASEITDGDHSPPPKAPTGVPFITISDIVKPTRELDFSNTFTVPAEYFRNLKPNKRPRLGDVLYTVRRW